ncbi:hypothetical protein CR513_60253, partial [Mucuna pruriens]
MVIKVVEVIAIQPPLSFIVQLPYLELKPLLKKLKYAYLEANQNLVQVGPKKFGMIMVLERLASKSHYYFLYGFPGYMHIHIALKDQHKTTFTCLFGIFACTRMPFNL